MTKGISQTISGKVIDLACPDPRDICIEDIAHSLSLQCRFNGHLKHFYSVAEHSVRCSWLCDEFTRRSSIFEYFLEAKRWTLSIFQYFIEVRRWALMHDAAEAYTGDITRPMRELINGSIAPIEENLERVIALVFKLRTRPMPPVVKLCDDILVVTEARDLMGEQAFDWEIEVEPLKEQITPWSAEVARETFLQEYQYLWRQK